MAAEFKIAVNPSGGKADPAAFYLESESYQLVSTKARHNDGNVNIDVTIDLKIRAYWMGLDGKMTCSPKTDPVVKLVL